MDGPNHKTSLRILGARVRWLALVCLLVVGASAVAYLVLRYTNPVTFLLFVAVIAWVLRHEWYHYRVLEDSILLLEKRVWALEQRSGIGNAWLKELEGARAAQRAFGGQVSEFVQWPVAGEDEDDLEDVDTGDDADEA